MMDFWFVTYFWHCLCLMLLSCLCVSSFLFLSLRRCWWTFWYKVITSIWCELLNIYMYTLQCCSPVAFSASISSCRMVLSDCRMWSMIQHAEFQVLQFQNWEIIMQFCSITSVIATLPTALPSLRVMLWHRCLAVWHYCITALCFSGNDLHVSYFLCSAGVKELPCLLHSHASGRDVPRDATPASRHAGWDGPQETCTTWPSCRCSAADESVCSLCPVACFCSL